MAEKSGGGPRKTLVTLRPRSTSKTRKPTRRKQPTPDRNGVSSTDQSRYNATTSFPLFSSNLLTSRPSVSHSSKAVGDAGKGKQSVLVNHASRTRLHGGQAQSPTPVEQVTSSSSCISLASVSRLSLKSEVITDYSRTGTLASDVCSDWEDSDVFPIKYLPDDCLLYIFSLLPSLDKGRCAQVCVHWSILLRTPSLWSHVAFSDLPFWCITSDEHNCLGNCYIRYRVRVKQFLAFLKELRPLLRSLEFKFDIGESADGFLQPLENLIDKANTKELRYASMNWKETPMRPFWADMSRNVQCDEVVQKHRLRQRMFVSFFDLFTQQCPKLQTLVVPFDWSDRSVDCLLRLQDLRSLVLEKYFVFQKLCQDLMDKVLLGLPLLKRLMLEVWTPSGHGLVFFSLVSPTIEYLDVSQSRGFYLKAIHLPCLKTLRIARHPWNGPLVMADRINVPCIYDVLAEGAPNLEKINEHYLEKSWREGKYKTLEEVLKNICSCKQHKSGWAM